MITGASRGLGAGMAARCAEAGIEPRPVRPHRARARRWAWTRAGWSRRGRRDRRGGGRPLHGGGGRARSAGSTSGSTTPGLLDPIAPLRDADPGRLAANIEVNVLGRALGSAAFARHVRSRPGGGVLVNISSGAATTPYEGWAAYCASKAAVDHAHPGRRRRGGRRRSARLRGGARGGRHRRCRPPSGPAPRERFPTVERFREMKPRRAVQQPRLGGRPHPRPAHRPAGRRDGRAAGARRAAGLVIAAGSGSREDRGQRASGERTARWRRWSDWRQTCPTTRTWW